MVPRSVPLVGSGARGVWFPSGRGGRGRHNRVDQLRQRPADSLKALGREPLPETIRVGGKRHRWVRLFKHDFFAVTALYEADDGQRVVLKIGRQADFLGFPCEWIGRWLASHEAWFYQRLADLDAVPRFMGNWGRCGFVHACVEGRPLRKGEPVPDDFFPRLQAQIEAVHQRKMAYVDLEKPQNVLVGDDGRPYLIDFQIAWYWPPRWGGDSWLGRLLLGRLQEADRYHLRKLQRRIRPDQLSPADLEDSYRRPWHIRLHQRITRPLTLLRRRALEYLAPERGTGERGQVN